MTNEELEDMATRILLLALLRRIMNETGFFEDSPLAQKFMSLSDEDADEVTKLVETKAARFKEKEKERT